MIIVGSEGKSKALQKWNEKKNISETLYNSSTVLEKAGKAKDLERYVLAINSEKQRLTKEP